MIRAEDRNVAIAVAVQIFCSRIQANGGKHGYSPDMDMCVGEAASLVNKMTLQIAPQERGVAMRVRRRKETVELQVNGQ